MVLTIIVVCVFGEVSSAVIYALVALVASITCLIIAASMLHRPGGTGRQDLDDRRPNAGPQEESCDQAPDESERY